MKPLSLVAVILLVALSRLEGGVIPFPEFFVSVETNDFLHRENGKHSLCVTVHMSQGSEGKGPRTSIDVNSFELSAGIRAFDETDRKMLLDVFQVAKDGREQTRTIISPAFTPRQIETTFASLQVDGTWAVRVTRGKETVMFDPDEGDRLRSALEDAHAGQMWFERLLSGEVPPEISTEIHPPHAQGYYLVSKMGEVDARGFIYRISLNCDPHRKENGYYAEQTVEFGRNGEDWGTMGGRWSGLLEQVANGLAALNRGEPYAFMAEDRKYRLEANRETNQVDVIFARSEFFPNRTPVIGHIGAAELQKINGLLGEVANREAWFREHEALFFEPVHD
jgi:hypothetical protein